MFHRILALLLAYLLAGCATSYQSSGLTGGYRDFQVEGDVYRVVFSGNGDTTRETTQTYWLYRAAELTLEKGFDGFEILSPIALGLGPSESPFIRTQMIFIPIYSPPKPVLEADIRLLKGPISPKPPKLFDARSLKNDLEAYVKGEKKCDGSNVCPHVKKYLQPTPEKAPAYPAAVVPGAA
jgi:hypothetical protein